MVDLLKTGSDFLGDKLKAFASQSVIYKRKDGDSFKTVTVLATFGRTEYEVDGEFSFVREAFESRDFMVHRADLIFDSETAELTPKEGDLIEWVFDLKTFLYEAMQPPTEPVWRWADAFNYRRRIHTKLISVTP